MMKKKPRCPDCKDTGVRKVRQCIPPLFGTGPDTETLKVRCHCTDERRLAQLGATK